MADAVISAPAVQSTPAGYQVPAAQEIWVKSVRAVVDGSAAGSAFLPTLQLVSPSGVVVWQSATDSTVAAGASADVSWFPLGHGTGAGAHAAVPNDNYGSAILALGPYAWYRLNETAGATAADSSGHGRNATYGAGTKTLGVPSLIPTSADKAVVNVNTDCQSAGTPWSVNTFTAMGWFATLTGAALASVVVMTSAAGIAAAFELILNNGQEQIRAFDSVGGGHFLNDTVDLRDGGRHFVAATYDHSRLRLYHNGTLVQTGAVDVFSMAVQNFQIGVGSQAPGVALSQIGGTLDEVVIFDYALAGSDIATLYGLATTT